MKAAVVYYSLDGNTKSVAEKIAERLGADIVVLEPVKPYPKGKVSKFFVGGKSSSFKEKPPLRRIDANIDEYDTIIIGTPLWAWNITPPVRTFLSKFDMTGKKVAAFVCSGGGDPEKAFENIVSEGRCDLVARQVFVNAKQNEQETETKVAEFCEKIAE